MQPPFYSYNRNLCFCRIDQIVAAHLTPNPGTGPGPGKGANNNPTVTVNRIDFWIQGRSEAMPPITAAGDIRNFRENVIPFLGRSFTGATIPQKQQTQVAAGPINGGPVEVPKRRTMSAEHKAKLKAAMKRRVAERKKAAIATAKETVGEAAGNERTGTTRQRGRTRTAAAGAQ